MRNIDKVIEFIKGEDVILEMATWRRMRRRQIGCRTAACLGGSAEAVMKREMYLSTDDKFVCDPTEEEIVQWLIEDMSVENREAAHEKLFYMEGVMDRLEEFDEAYTAETRKRMGIRVLEILRDEGVIDWMRAIGDVRERGS